METLLAYLLKSTMCISVLYLVFRWTLKKENLFALNRFLLLVILVSSVAIPLIKLPVLFHQSIDVKVFPEKHFIEMPNMDDVAMQITTIPTTQYAAVSTERSLSVEQITSIIYVVGVLTLFILLLIAFAKIGLLLINTKVYRKKNYNLALVNGTVSPMSFGRFIIMSKQDFKDHRKEILKHELTHIKFKHTYDLLLVELVKLFHWFNPLVYQLRNDLKEIQEFQVDHHLLRSGINSKEYQLLLIKKCVGAERYALANSFNHCQIKNRIVMMNHSKNSKGKSWKVAIFLPVAALMLMAFGNNQSEIPPDFSTPEIAEIAQEKKIWTESDFEKIPSNELKDLQEKDFFNNKKWHIVLINRYSQILMDNEKTELNEVGPRMKKILENALAKVSSDTNNETKSIVPKVLIRKDLGTDANNYSKLLNSVASAFINAREEFSKSKFGKDYNNLINEDKMVIDAIIPINIKISVPKQMGTNTSSTSPPVFIDIKEDGIYCMNDLVSLDRLREIITRNIASHPNQIISLKVASEVKMGDVTAMKEVLREAKALHINYSTDFREKNYPEKKGKMSPTPINVKNGGIFIGKKETTIDQLKKLVELNTPADSVMQFILEIDEGVTQSRIDEVKLALKDAKIVRTLIIPASTTSVTQKTMIGSVKKADNVVVFVDRNIITLDGKNVPINKLASEINEQLTASKQPLTATVNVTTRTKPETFLAVKAQLRDTKVRRANYYSVSKEIDSID
jgi:beta-lactamase regulating signal transducer with metallopeptidase domain/biopolymer transport protein ExbD